MAPLIEKCNTDGRSHIITKLLRQQFNLKGTGPGTYTVSWHNDWTIGSNSYSLDEVVFANPNLPAFAGSAISGLIHHAVSTYLAEHLPAQPDVLKMHLEFVRASECTDGTVTITQIKLGRLTSHLQVQYAQKGQLRVLALVVATDLTKPVGPSVPTTERWFLQQPRPPNPKPDFAAARRPDPNWLPAIMDGETLPLTRHQLVLNPAGGFPHDGLSDAWNRLLPEGDDRIDAMYLAVLADIFPSLSDTGLRNGGALRRARQLPAARGRGRGTPGRARRAAAPHPGVPAAGRGLQHDGAAVGVYSGRDEAGARGRMDLDVSICDEDMELVVTAQQLVLVVEAQRKFRGGGGGGGESKTRL
ncbi:thioesterase-like superfamily-domain-containing protein [Apiospora saccharicola]|uniref:Thioesterase-like superfamily-domain-containing protein n=1 Tax=Apiospora saccharicola TaxID=335842 RepID=A0ABR1VC33_9PEZI